VLLLVAISIIDTPLSFSYLLQRSDIVQMRAERDTDDVTNLCSFRKASAAPVVTRGVASSIGAWAGYAGVGKTFPKVAAAPRVFIEGNYASGTKNPKGRDWNTFDQLYPSNHDKFGFTDQVGRRNLVQFRVGVEESVGKKWKFKEAFEGFWLATSNDNFYSSSGAISVPATPGASRHIGNELDLVAEYEWNNGLNFGFGYARLFAGEFLKTTTPGHDYGYPYAYVEYNFSKSGFHFPITPNKPN
jgi:hypothetical protein